jgi:hypothetical protein
MRKSSLLWTRYIYDYEEMSPATPEEVERKKKMQRDKLKQRKITEIGEEETTIVPVWGRKAKKIGT